MENNEILELTTSSCKEDVYIETVEHVIKGSIFMPKIGKRTRLLSEVLNSSKQFIAVKDCTIESKLVPQKDLEKHPFVQVNISTILLMRPLNED